MTDTVPTLIDPGQALVIDYTNHAGKRSFRRILPIGIWFGVSEFHPGEVDPQWYVSALDIDRYNPDAPDLAKASKDATRDFLWRNIHETLTVAQWEHRAKADERWREMQRAWQTAQR